jgi:hypothetical protein
MKHVKRNTENMHQVEIKALVSYIATGDFSRLQENYLLRNHKSMNKKWPNLFLDATISFSIKNMERFIINRIRMQIPRDHTR